MLHELMSSRGQSVVCAGSGNGTLRVYDTLNYGTVFGTNSPGGISAVALSADSGMLATGSINGDVHFWKNMYRP